LLEGRIDDVILFSKIVRPSEIRHLMYNVLYPQETQSLVGYWSFDEGLGDIAIDGSEEKNNGQIFGGAQFRVEDEKPVHLKPFQMTIRSIEDEV
jgi:hypothetical protein